MLPYSNRSTAATSLTTNEITAETFVGVREDQVCSSEKLSVLARASDTATNLWNISGEQYRSRDSLKAIGRFPSCLGSIPGVTTDWLLSSYKQGCAKIRYEDLLILY